MKATNASSGHCITGIAPRNYSQNQFEDSANHSIRWIFLLVSASDRMHNYLSRHRQLKSILWSVIDALCCYVIT